MLGTVALNLSNTERPALLHTCTSFIHDSHLRQLYDVGVSSFTVSALPNIHLFRDTGGSFSHSKMMKDTDEHIEYFSLLDGAAVNFKFTMTLLSFLFLTYNGNSVSVIWGEKELIYVKFWKDLFIRMSVEDTATSSKVENLHVV